MKCEITNRGTNYASREDTQQWKSCDENKRNKTSVKNKSRINIGKTTALVKTAHKRLTDGKSERLLIRNKNGVMSNSSDEHITSYNSKKKINRKRTKQMKTAFEKKDDKISTLPRRSSHDSQHSSRWKWNWRMKQRLGTPPGNKCISGSTQATSRRVQGDVKRANENIPRKLSCRNNIPKCKRMRRLMRDMGYFDLSTQYATVLQIAYINTRRRRIIDVNRKGGVLRKTSLKKLLVPTASPN
ncbi:hypothetical protein RR46_00045 [Papilio xuthus]|uniref:Uncharacterized protein n=1 Tax=Papilio xuthus TaxID=66420 RepID=A0A0N1IQD8_PAPXU|nr:hypothetical protein RR46_00045 [Papilio xuthus]